MSLPCAVGGRVGRVGFGNCGAVVLQLSCPSEADRPSKACAPLPMSRECTLWGAVAQARTMQSAYVHQEKVTLTDIHQACHLPKVTKAGTMLWVARHARS